MTKKSLPSVGFDRFVELTWAEHALDVAISEGEPDQLKNWLTGHIEGEVSARKTFNLLSNLWLKSFPETEQIRIKALALASQVGQQDRTALHWGMALANFELFQQTTASMGKLLRLQGSFAKKGIQQRMAEVYSNQGTIPRAVARIIQSLCEWSVIQETDKNTYMAAMKNSIRDESLSSWLLQAALNRQKSRPVSISEIFRLPELFPFDVVENGQKLIRESPAFAIIREGLNQEYVILRGDER
jgi:hypothetical protein